MHANRRRLLRLVAVVAIITAALVPTVAGAAGPTYECDGNQYDATNPDHVLYGVTAQTPVVGGQMVVDLSLETPLSGVFVVFWDGGFVSGSDGAQILGSVFKDVICGTSGNDWIYGDEGNDRIFGMDNTDGYTAPDPLHVPPIFEAWGDNLFGNKGDDLLVNGQIGDYANEGSFLGGGVGNDLIFAGDGDFSFARGGTQPDTMVGGAGLYQSVLGGADNDVVLAGSGDYQHVNGNASDDTVIGGSGQGQIVEGNHGADNMTGGSGLNQRVYSGMENDTLGAGTGTNQVLFGGVGNDTINQVGSGTNQVADGGAGADSIHPSATAPFWAFGGSEDDLVYGGTAADWLYGDYGVAQNPDWTVIPFVPFPVNALATGNDWLQGGDGADELYGGPGNDTTYGMAPNSGTQLDIGDGDIDVMFGNDGSDTGFGFCEVGGVTFSDTVDGSTGTVDVSWNFWPANTTGIETQNAPCA